MFVDGRDTGVRIEVLPGHAVDGIGADRDHFEVRVRGPGGHSSRGDEASAFLGLVRFANALRHKVGDSLELTLPSTSLAIGYRPLPGQLTITEVLVHDALAQTLAEQGPGVSVKTDWKGSSEGLNTPMDAELVEFLERAAGTSARTESFATEGDVLQRFGASEVAVLSGGTSRVAHGPEEHISVPQLLGTAAVLARALKRYSRPVLRPRPSSRLGE